MKGLLLLLLALPASADIGNLTSPAARASTSTPTAIYVNDYTNSTATTTAAGGADPNKMYFFSTATIAANTLARNGDSLKITCSGTIGIGGGGVKDIGILANGGTVVISSRTTALGSASLVFPWSAQSIITRVSAGNQVYFCLMGAAGTCASAGATPGNYGGTLTLDETQSIRIHCAAKDYNAGLGGDVKYLNMIVEKIAAP